jgi:hypothetical protein
MKKRHARRGGIRRGAILLVAAVAVVLGAVWAIGRHNADDAINHTITLVWGDGAYGKAFYGAHVYEQVDGKTVTVRARILIGQGNGYEQDLGTLGVAASHAEAVATWGKVEWKPDGLHIGPGNPTEKFVPQSEVEAHR